MVSAPFCPQTARTSTAAAVPNVETLFMVLLARCRALVVSPIMFLGRYGIMTGRSRCASPASARHSPVVLSSGMDGAPIEFSSAAAHLMRWGQIFALDVVGAHLDRIAEVNPMLNAVVALDVDAAIASAHDADSLEQKGQRSALSIGCR